MRKLSGKIPIRIVGNREAETYSGGCKEKGSDSHQQRKSVLAEFAHSFLHQRTSDGVPDLRAAETSGPEEYGPMDQPFMEDLLP